MLKRSSGIDKSDRYHVLGTAAAMKDPWVVISAFHNHGVLVRVFSAALLPLSSSPTTTENVRNDAE